MEKTTIIKEYLRTIASRGGNTTLKKYGKGHFAKLSKLASKTKKKKLSTARA
jgi:hypothetical protein